MNVFGSQSALSISAAEDVVFKARASAGSFRRWMGCSSNACKVKGGSLLWITFSLTISIEETMRCWRASSWWTVFCVAIVEYNFCSGNVNVRFDIFPVHEVHLQHYIAESLYSSSLFRVSPSRDRGHWTGLSLFTERSFFVADQAVSEIGLFPSDGCDSPYTW